MVVVVLIAVLVGGGVAVAVLMSRSKGQTSDEFIDVSSRIDPALAESHRRESIRPPAPEAAAPPAPEAAAPPAPTPAPPPAAAPPPPAEPATPSPVEEARPETAATPSATSEAPAAPEPDEDEEDLSARFNAPGQRRAGSSSYVPTTPRKPAHLAATPAVPGSEPADAEPADAEPAVTEADEPVAVAEAVTPAPEAVPEPEPLPEPERETATDELPDGEAAAVEPTASAAEPAEAPEPQGAAVEPDATSAPEPAPEATPEVAATDEAQEAEPLVLEADPEPVLVLDEGRVVEQVEDDDVDHVLHALIRRMGVADNHVAEVASELVERSNMGASEVVEVLADLVGESEAAELAAARGEELTLFSEEVPRRPGQLSDFANLSGTDRRRVIVRVLCLLVARTEEQDIEADSSPISETRRGWPTGTPPVEVGLPEQSTDDEEDLPARRLERSRP